MKWTVYNSLHTISKGNDGPKKGDKECKNCSKRNIYKYKNEVRIF